MKKGKQSTEPTLERRLRILAVLPEEGHGHEGYTAQELADMFSRDGNAVDLRTVQRDLAALSRRASIWHRLNVRLDGGKPAAGQALRWRHQSGSRLRFMSIVSPQQALMLGLMERELQQFLPQSTLEEIGGHISGAQRLLDAPYHADYARYLERIRILPEGPQRVSPEALGGLLAPLNEALLKGEQVDLLYFSAREQREKHYRLHPVGLVQQGMYYWLLAVKHENTGQRDLLSKIQTYRHDRMRGFTRRHAEPVERRLPTLDAAIAAGRHEHFADEQPVKLALRFAATEDGERLCDSFRAAPLGAGQSISANAAGGHDLHTEVRDSLQLRWLLQRYADRVQVLAPPALAQHVRDFVRSAAAMQGG